MSEPPESFPVNALVAIEGTPLEKNEPVTIHDMLRTIATARIVLKSSIIRLAAGRTSYSETEQAMCFMAGANAVSDEHLRQGLTLQIFTGGRMLTTPTNEYDADGELMRRWGLTGLGSFESDRMAPHGNLDQPSQPAVESVSVSKLRA